MSAERRDLAMTVQTDSGHEAVVPKGGLPRLDGSLDVRFVYRELPGSIRCAQDATAEDVEALVKARAEAMDERADWDDFAADLVGEDV